MKQTQGIVKKINLPFEGKRWAILIGSDKQDLFAHYRTKKAALEDAREYGIKIVKTRVEA